MPVLFVLLSYPHTQDSSSEFPQKATNLVASSSLLIMAWIPV